MFLFFDLVKFLVVTKTPNPFLLVFTRKYFFLFSKIANDINSKSKFKQYCVYRWYANSRLIQKFHSPLNIYCFLFLNWCTEIVLMSPKKLIVQIDLCFEYTRSSNENN